MCQPRDPTGIPDPVRRGQSLSRDKVSVIFSAALPERRVTNPLVQGLGELLACALSMHADKEPDTGSAIAKTIAKC